MKTNYELLGHGQGGQPQDTIGLTLLIPQKPDVERDEVAQEWQRQGGEVLRLDRFWEPPGLNPETVRIYGPDTFATVLGHILGLRLLEPAPDLALSVPQHFLRREVFVEKLGVAIQGSFPIFTKPLVPKLFPAQVVRSPVELRSATAGLDAGERILLSEPIHLEAEVRLFLLDGTVLDAATYEGTADAVGAITPAEQLAAQVDLPRSVVLDFGLIADGQWVFIEANAAWGSGLNGCKAARILPAIAAAIESRRDSV